MDTPLKARNASKSLHRSPSSVTEIKNGSLVVSEEALGHIQDMFHAGLIPNLPEPLPFVNPNTPDDFKESVHQYLRTFGGGSFGNLMGPNTMAQFSSIVAVLAGHIEINPLFQEMVRCVNHPLAVCGLILDRSGAIIWLDRPAPPLPWQLMFE